MGAHRRRECQLNALGTRRSDVVKRPVLVHHQHLQIAVLRVPNHLALLVHRRHEDGSIPLCASHHTSTTTGIQHRGPHLHGNHSALQADQRGGHHTTVAVDGAGVLADGYGVHHRQVLVAAEVVESGRVGGGVVRIAVEQLGVRGRRERYFKGELLQQERLSVQAGKGVGGPGVGELHEHAEVEGKSV